MNELSKAIKPVIGLVRLSLQLLITTAVKNMSGPTIVMKGHVVSEAR